MDNRYFLIALLFLLVPGAANAQRDNYKLEFAPDLWYNSIDGVRVGARAFGHMEGTFQDGPHRLDAGVWLGTNFPDQPVSYYVSLTEPIPSLSSYGSEANIRVRSSIRTGYSHHEVALNKRFQPGFNELVFREFSFSLSQEKLIDISYRPYAQLWQNNWKTMAGGTFWWSDVNSIGKFDLKTGIHHNLASESGNFTVGSLEIKQQIPIGNSFHIRLRGFSGLTNNEAAPEYMFSESFRQPIGWLNNGVSRAKGTLPQSLLDEGLFQVAGGANLRGYADQNFEALVNGTFVPYNFANSISIEFEFPNPINSALDKSIIGDFVKLKSYMFADGGYLYRKEFQDTPDIIGSLSEQKADAGFGLQFSINIPDWLGKDRGFAIRYDVPFWLSDPANGEKSFKFRNLIGIGAVISL